MDAAFKAGLSAQEARALFLRIAENIEKVMRGRTTVTELVRVTGK